MSRAKQSMDVVQCMTHVSLCVLLMLQLFAQLHPSSDGECRRSVVCSRTENIFGNQVKVMEMESGAGAWGCRWLSYCKCFGTHFICSPGSFIKQSRIWPENHPGEQASMCVQCICVPVAADL